jgi:hypothetical protein
MSEDRGSIRKLMDVVKSPALIQVKSATSMLRTPSVDTRWIKRDSEAMNDANTDPHATTAVNPSVNLFVLNATNKKPNKGNKGTKLTRKSMLTISNDSRH